MTNRKEPTVRNDARIGDSGSGGDCKEVGDLQNEE